MHDERDGNELTVGVGLTTGCGISAMTGTGLVPETLGLSPTDLLTTDSSAFRLGTFPLATVGSSGNGAENVSAADSCRVNALMNA